MPTEIPCGHNHRPLYNKETPTRLCTTPTRTRHFHCRTDLSDVLIKDGTLGVKSLLYLSHSTPGINSPANPDNTSASHLCAVQVQHATPIWLHRSGDLVIDPMRTPFTALGRQTSNKSGITPGLMVTLPQLSLTLSSSSRQSSINISGMGYICSFISVCLP